MEILAERVGIVPNLRMPEGWSRQEVEAIVSDYFKMFLSEVRGEDFNKAERNRLLQKLLNRRSHSSVEWKHQNISAILVQLGFPYLRGYKPRYNYQELLKVVVEEQLAAETELLQLIDDVVTQPARAPVVENILSVLVEPPKQEEAPPRVQEAPRRHTFSRKNYLKIEAENHSLGLAGEEFVMEFEHKRLWHAGKKRLADRIEHVARTRGDGLGYDILSFEESGCERLIEVKTTRFGSLTPFFVSPKEAHVSQAQQTQYQLYRLYGFRRDPKLFILPGCLMDTCTLEPFQYVGLPQSVKYPTPK